MTTKVFTFENWDTDRLLSEWTPMFETDPSPFEIEEDKVTRHYYLAGETWAKIRVLKIQEMEGV